jgi:hypothetical protein
MAGVAHGRDELDHAVADLAGRAAAGPLGIEDRVGDVMTRQRVRRNDVQLLLGADGEG